MSSPRVVSRAEELGDLVALVPQRHIARAFLQGFMGRAVVAGAPPVRAAVVVGDFVLLVGAPGRDVIDLLRREPGEELHVHPAASAWRPVVDGAIADGARLYTREVFDWHALDRQRFQAARAELRAECPVSMIDRATAAELLSEPWSRDSVANFVTPERFVDEAFGAVVRCGGRIVSVAGSYTRYEDGIELEVDTHPEFRRRGFARAACAAVISEALRRGLAVHWDAMNEASAALARSLGYTASRRYECLEVPRAGVRAGGPAPAGGAKTGAGSS